MLPDPVPSNLAHLTPYELETIFWQARGFDAYYKSAVLLQIFFEEYVGTTQPLRIRTTTGRESVTNQTTAKVMEWSLSPKLVLLATVRKFLNPVPMIRLSGAQDILHHAALGFAPLHEQMTDTILDLSSMQFGDVGRGLISKTTFALESPIQYNIRLRKVSTYMELKVSQQLCKDKLDEETITSLKSAAQRAKLRWDARETRPFCGHCGAPSEPSKPKRCTACMEVHYCNLEHQTLARPFHKKFCTGRASK